jgi:tetratricopeptide (TPR) repeat protein
MNNLAVTLSTQGNLLQGRELHQETLRIQRRVLGADHPNTLATIKNLAAVLSKMGEVAGARTLLEEMLAMKHRVLGPEHADTLSSMNNLALALSAEGNLPRAGQLQEEQLEICRRLMGPEHPVTSISAWNLVTTLHKMEEPEAEWDVIDRDLIWLLSIDPAILSPEQRDIRDSVEFVRRKNDSPPNHDVPAE